MACVNLPPFATIVHDVRVQLPHHSRTAQGQSLAVLQILQALVEPGCNDLAALSLQEITLHLEVLTREFGAATPIETVIQELVQREQISALQTRDTRKTGGEERLV